MLRHALTVGVVLDLASFAHAAAVISLTPNPPGPYLGGELITVDAVVTTDESFTIRLLAFDFTQTDAALTLLGPDGPDLDTTPEFQFDFSSNPWSYALYSTFPNFPNPSMALTSVCAVSGHCYLHFGAGLPLRVGSLQVQLPTAPGDYILDAANYLAEDLNQGARIDFDFSNPQIWSAFADGNVEISGGQLVLTVIPEPATLTLLGLGLIVRARRRGCA